MRVLHLGDQHSPNGKIAEALTPGEAPGVPWFPFGSFISEAVP